MLAVEFVILLTLMALMGIGLFEMSGTVDEANKSGYPFKHLININTGNISCAALSGNGQLLASGHQDGTIELWNTTSGTLISTISGHDTEVSTIQLSADKNLISSFSAMESKVRHWNLTTLELIQVDVTYSNLSQLTNHTNWIFAFGINRAGMLIYHFTTNESLHVYSWVLSVASSRGGGVFAFGSNDGSIGVYECETEVMVRTIRAHGVSSVAFSSRNVLVSGSSDGWIRFWDPMSGELMHGFEGARAGGEAVSVALSSQADVLAEWSYGGDVINVWLL